jgi:hypothetical protein
LLALVLREMGKGFESPWGYFKWPCEKSQGYVISRRCEGFPPCFPIEASGLEPVWMESDSERKAVPFTPDLVCFDPD